MPSKKDLLIKTAVASPRTDEVVRTPTGTEVIVFSPRSQVRNKVNAWLQDHQQFLREAVAEDAAGYFPLWPILDAAEVLPPPALTCPPKPPPTAPRTRQRSLDFLDANPMLATGETQAAALHRQRGFPEPSSLSEEDNVSVEFSQECASTVPDPRLASPAAPPGRRGKEMRSASYHADSFKAARPAPDGRPPLRYAASSASLLDRRAGRRSSLGQLGPELRVAETYRTGPNETLLTSTGEEVMVFSPRLPPEAEADLATALTMAAATTAALEDEALATAATPPVVTITSSNPPSAHASPKKAHSARSLALLRVDAAVAPAAPEGPNERVRTPQGTPVCVFSPKVGSQHEWLLQPGSGEAKSSPPPRLPTGRARPATLPAALKRCGTVPVLPSAPAPPHGRQRRSSLAMLSLELEIPEPYRATTKGGEALNETVMTPKGHEVMVFSPKVSDKALPDLARRLAAMVPPALERPERRSSNVSGNDDIFAGFQFGSNDAQSPAFSSTSSNPPSARFSGGSNSSSPQWRRNDPSPRPLKAVYTPGMGAAGPRPAAQPPHGPPSGLFGGPPAQAAVFHTAEGTPGSPASPAWPTYQPHEVQLPTALRRHPGTTPTTQQAQAARQRRRSSLAVLKVDAEVAEPYRERTPAGGPLNETVLTPTGHEVMVFSPKVGSKVELPDPVHGPLEVQLPPALHSPGVGPGSEASSRRVSFSADTFGEYRFGEYRPPSLGSSTDSSPRKVGFASADGSPKFRRKDHSPNMDHSPRKDHSPRSLPLLRVETAVAKAAADKLNERVRTPQGTPVCVFSPKVAEPSAWGGAATGLLPPSLEGPVAAAGSPAPPWPHDVQLPAALKRRVSVHAPSAAAQQQQRRRSSLAVLKVDTEVAEPYREGTAGGGPLNETVLTPTGHEVMVFSPKVGPKVELPDPVHGPLEVQLPPALVPPGSEASSRRVSFSADTFGEYRFGECHPPSIGSSSDSSPRKLCSASVDGSPKYRRPNMDHSPCMDHSPRKDHSPRSLPLLKVETAVAKAAADKLNERVRTPQDTPVCLFSPKVAEPSAWGGAATGLLPPSLEGPAAAVGSPTSPWPHEVQLPAALRRQPGAAAPAATAPPTHLAQPRQRRRSSLAVLKVDTEVAEPYRARTEAGGPLNETVLTPTGHEVMVFSPKVGPKVELPDPAHEPLEVQLPPALHSPGVGSVSGGSSRQVSFSADTFAEYGFGCPPSISSSSTDSSPRKSRAAPADGSPKFRRPNLDHSPRGVCVLSPKESGSGTWTRPAALSATGGEPPSASSSPWPHEVQLPAALRRQPGAAAPAATAPPTQQAQAARQRRRSSLAVLKVDAEVAEPYRERTEAGGPLNETVLTPTGHEVMVFSPKVGSKVELPDPANELLEVQLPPALHSPGLNSGSEASSRQVSFSADAFAEYRFGDELAPSITSSMNASPDGSPKFRRTDHSPRKDHSPRSLPLLRVETAVAKAAADRLNERVRTPQGTPVCVFSPKVAEPSAWPIPVVEATPPPAVPPAPTSPAWPTFLAHQVQLPAALRRRVSAPPPDSRRPRRSSLAALKVETEIPEPYREGASGGGPLNETVLTPKGHEVMVFSPKCSPHCPLPDPSVAELALPPALQPMAAAGVGGGQRPAQPSPAHRSGLQARVARRQSLPILNVRVAAVLVEEGPLNELVRTPTGTNVCVFSPKVSDPQHLPAWETHSPNWGSDGPEAWPVFGAGEVSLPAALQPRPAPPPSDAPAAPRTSP